MTPLPLGISHGVPLEQYRADPGINQSLLKQFGCARTPAHFRYELTQPRKDTPSLRIGNYLDCAIHGTAEDVARRFVVWEAERRGNAWKDFKAAHPGKEILNAKEADTAADCALALARHEDTQRIIAACQKQICVIAEHPVHGIRLKALLDLKPDRSRCSDQLWPYIFDVKTSEDASPEGFSDWCYTWGYDIQAYSYIKVCEYVGEMIQAFGFIVVETNPPHAIKIHFINRGSAVYNNAEAKFEEWLPKFEKCRKENSFPGYGDEWSEILFKPWQLRRGGYAERQTLI